MRKKLCGEGGFTLSEVLVAMVLMAVVLFALYAVFDAAVRVFAAGRSEAEAAQDARQGLARMEREIRAAYPQDRANGETALLADFGETRLAFGNDLNGNRRIADPATGAAEDGEGISYTANAGGTPVRNGVRMIRFAKDIDGDGKALTFEYLDANGDVVAEEAGVALVRIKLEISVDRKTGESPVERVLSTAVALRNR